MTEMTNMSSTSLDEEGGSANPLSLVNPLALEGSGSLKEKLDRAISSNSVVIFSKSHCPFCLDVKNLFETIHVPIQVLEVNVHPEGPEIFKLMKEKTKQNTVPMVFIQNNFKGGCDAIKALHAKDELMKLVSTLSVKPRVTGATTIETAKLVPTDRGVAQHPLFWFPNVVNNYVVRITGLQVFFLCVVSIIFYKELWAAWIAAFLLIDFLTRLMVGSSLSVLGMMATLLSSPFEPQFKPGPPKQFASFCGVCFSLVATGCYFTGNELYGAIVLAGLAGAAGMEGFLDFCLGCVFFALGIRFHLIPNMVYRIYTSSRPEVVESWKFANLPCDPKKPRAVDTNPKSEVSLKYKVKNDDWTREDFHLIRHMQVSYFSMPLAIAGLAVAFKMGSNWSFKLLRIKDFHAAYHVSTTFHKALGCVAAVIYGIMLILYGLKLVLHRNKCTKEWHSPFTSPAFGAITISLMLFAFLVYDVQDDEDSDSRFARAIFWIGAVVHALLTIVKCGEWIGIRMEMEHISTSWLILPVGLMVAALIGPIIPAIDTNVEAPWYLPQTNPAIKEALVNLELSRFFFSFAYLMWICLFVITFFKVVTTHNSDPRQRHSHFIWIAAPAVTGLAEYIMCFSFNSIANPTQVYECAANFTQYYFLALFLLLCLIYASMPYISFFGQNKFNMGYWTECFALDTVAACSCFYFALTGYYVSKVLMVMFIIVASIANVVAFMHTIVCIVRRREVFTPEEKWGPLSFMKLTHEALRGGIPKLSAALEAIDLKDNENKNLHLFAALFSQLTIVHYEHSHHEDEVIFKTFNDYFHDHAKKFNDDHEEDRVLLADWHDALNKLLNVNTDNAERQQIVERLQHELPPFLNHMLEHLLGEEDHLSPIGKRYLPLEVQKEIARKAFAITSAQHWEVIIPFVINNLPRHPQRVRFLKCLAWSLPERAQQIGAMVYRNVDAVMWERIRVEVPEVIPRGAYNWRRYY